ncbi:galactokinase family protein [uncultured Catenibacterium sp.]|uniref:galactokinase n=1 Tax=uncultured Catenibacterium sp. TaxID=286142 RepID=UPI0025EDD26F|nr:galactokinase family protein [uncultured Catenibacterium sp.]
MQASLILKKLSSGELIPLLKGIYSENIDDQLSRYRDALQSFIDYYGDQDVMILSVPGKCEIGGNHTDHQHGRVLASAIQLDSICIVAKQERYAKVIYNELSINEIDTENIKYNVAKKGTMESLITGVLFGLNQKNYHIGGFNAYIDCRIPRNVGLGSSANFNIMIGTIINYLYNEGKIENQYLVQIGRFATNTFYCKPSGLMNECVCCVGGFIKVDFKDTNLPDIHKLNIDFSNFDYALCCVNSNMMRSDNTVDYDTIPNEMIKVANFFKKDVLREVSFDEFMKNYRLVRARVGDRPALRALHFFKEEDRVLKQSEALEKGDFNTFLKLVKESGDSTFKALQNIYPQGSTRHQNIGTAIVLSENFLGEDGVVKVNGGGFSGTMLAFVKTDRISEYVTYMDSVIGKGSCHIIHTREQGAIRLL